MIGRAGALFKSQATEAGLPVNEARSPYEFMQLLEEVNRKVRNVEPLAKGTGSLVGEEASTFFCLVYGFMRLSGVTEENLSRLLEHPNPYVKAAGCVIVR